MSFYGQESHVVPKVLLHQLTGSNILEDVNLFQHLYDKVKF
jgi:hypothetical protein